MHSAIQWRLDNFLYQRSLRGKVRLHFARKSKPYSLHIKKTCDVYLFSAFLISERTIDKFHMNCFLNIHSGIATVTVIIDLLIYEVILFH